MINHCVGKLPVISLLEYLGLSDEILPTPPTEVVQNEKFNVCSSGITVQENGEVAVHDSSRRHAYAFGNSATILWPPFLKSNWRSSFSLFLLFFCRFLPEKLQLLNHFGCFRFERGRLYQARNDTELMQVMDFTDSMQVCYQVTSIKSVAFIRLCASC